MMLVQIKRKALFSSAALVMLVMNPLTNVLAASTQIVQFGDKANRTHDNGITDPYPWAKESFLKSVIDPSTGQSISLAGNNTAVGAGGQLFYPVSAPNGDPNGTGYMVGLNTGKGNWVWNSATNQYVPKVEFVTPIKGVSNSSPVYDPKTGEAYLAAGHQLYAFKSTGEDKTIMPEPSNLYIASPVYRNQIVSYPLYVTASQQGSSSDEIWVSSQNGNLYAVNPSTLQDDQVVQLGERLDASPSLVQASDGTSYIAVTAASNGNNKSWGGHAGTGMLFLVNPRDGAITATVPDPDGAIASVSSPIGIAPGLIMWNDIDGNVFLGHVQSNGTVTNIQHWNNIGHGATANNAEAGYSEDAHEYVLPFTSGAGVGIVDTQTGKSYLFNGSGIVKPSGSPEISAGNGVGNDNLYIPDSAGAMVEIQASGKKFNSSSKDNFLPTWGTSGVNSLTTPSELNLGAFNGNTEPTLTLATDQGLEMWLNVGANYTFGSGAPSGNNWTNQSASSFDYPLTLTYNQSQSNLPTHSIQGTTDKFTYEMSVNGGAYTTISGLPASDVNVFDAAGDPVPSFKLDTSTLNNDFAPWKSPDWQAGQPNNVIIRVKAAKGDTYGYTFNSSDVGDDKSYGQVDIQFPGQATTPPSAPSNPMTGCMSYNNTSCSSTLSGYTEWRFLPPAMTDTNEAHVFPSGRWFSGGTAYKIHPIPEQAINSQPAAQYTSYYGYQENPDGQDTQTKNWLNNFTVEFVNGSGGDVQFGVQGSLTTTGDVLYKKTYISSWQPHWRWISTLTGGYWSWNGYTPNDSTEYLYRNLAVTEKTNNATIRIAKNVTHWWNPSTVTVNVAGNFNATETPITPAGNQLTWTQGVWAAYGGWIPEGATYGTNFSQVPVTTGLDNTNTHGLSPNSMLPGTPTDEKPANAPAPDTLNGVWYSNAPTPPIPTPGDTSAQGKPASHPYDAEHNGGVIFQPNVAHTDYPQLKSGEWWVLPTYTITSGGSTFEHTQISNWIPTWAKLWGHNTGQAMATGSSTSVQIHY